MKDLVDRLEEHGVIKRGHFKLSSGRHSNTYINKDSAYCIPELFKEIFVRMLMEVTMYQHDVITGPALAGAVLAAPLSLYTGTIFVYPEKVNGKMVFRRGYDKILKNKRVLLIEDIITTGASVQKTVNAIETNGGTVVCVVAIWNRSGWKPGYPVVSLIYESVESWSEEECIECKKGTKLQDPKEL